MVLGKDHRTQWRGPFATRRRNVSPRWELSYVFRARVRMTGTHLLGDRLGVKGQWYVKEGLAGLGQLTFLRHNISSGVFLNVLQFVWDRRDESGIKEHLALCGSVKFLPEELRWFAHSTHVVGASVARLFASSFLAEDQCWKTNELSPDSRVVVGGRKQRAQASWDGFGTWDLKRTGAARTSSRSGMSKCE